MEILRAKPEDASALTAIALSAKRHWRYPEHWIESWLPLLTILPDYIRTHETFVGQVEQRNIGFYALAKEEDRISLEHLWVLPEAMGKGIGRALFTHALGRASEMGFSEIDIESDPNAEGFYLRLGAQRTGTKVQHVAGQRRELPLLICRTAALR
jgi:ribosomal protein S18 acetylase RimI-like enzyme